MATITRLAWHVQPCVSRVQPLAKGVRIAKIVKALPPRQRHHLSDIMFMADAKGYSQVTCPRLVHLHLLSKRINDLGIAGAFVECGVWKGGAAAVMTAVAARSRVERKVWLFDSFEGMPEARPEDGTQAAGLARNRFGGRLTPVGSNVAMLDDVKRLFFKKYHFPRHLVEFRKGWFQETLPRSREAIGPIALLRIDCDWYESTKVVLDELYDQVVPGGFVIVDDYGLFPGCKRAVDEFLVSRGIRVDIRPADREGVFFQKPSLY
jgi:O-methyltransferase